METELCLAAKSCSLQLESRLADSCCLLGMEIDRSLTQHAPQQSSAHAHSSQVHMHIYIHRKRATAFKIGTM
jgi:hypothetical protein